MLQSLGVAMEIHLVTSPIGKAATVFVSVAKGPPLHRRQSMYFLLGKSVQFIPVWGWACDLLLWSLP
jgi:hypothetical protein